MNKILVVISFCVVILLVAGAIMMGDETDHEALVPFEQTVSTPEITFGYPNDFGLALTGDQALVSSYIPPCDEGFDYCLYYNDDTYKDTNFGSASIGIKKRTDLITKEMCLSTLPEGWSSFDFVYDEQAGYATSAGRISGAAAGHRSDGFLYRLSFEPICYEFETRVSQSQFANYEPGSIKEFTTANMASLEQKIAEIIDHIVITQTKETVQFAWGL